MMIYVRNKFLFIHIPRTAGMSITYSLVKAMNYENFLSINLATGPPIGGLARHSNIRVIEKALPHDEFDDVFKFAVYRSRKDIVESDFRLHKKNQGIKNAGSLWMKTVNLSRNENLEQFEKRRWNRWIGDKEPWDHWTENREDVFKIDFYKLEEEWPKLLEIIGLPTDAKLYHKNTA